GAMGARVEPGAVGRGLREVVAAPDEHQRALRRGLVGQRLGQRGLADARLAPDEHQAPATDQGRRELLGEQRLLALPPYQQGGLLVIGGRRRGRSSHATPRPHELRWSRSTQLLLRRSYEPSIARPETASRHRAGTGGGPAAEAAPRRRRKLSSLYHERTSSGSE